MSPPVSNLRRSAGPPEPLGLLPDWDLSRFNSIDQRYFQSLRGERDAQLLFEALVSLAGRWESQGRDGDALQLYSHLLQTAPAGMPGFARVGERRQALQGQGSVGSRVEVAARRFFHQATDPAMIFGFMVAGGAAGLARNFTLGSLALHAEAWWTRGWVARALAGGAAFSAEVPALVGATRLAQIAQDPDRGFGSLETLPRELGGAALFLGALKLSGLGVGALVGRRRFAPLFRGAGALGGIYLGHRLEEGFGLRPAQDESNRWFDAAETFVQLQIGGRLAASLFGPRNPALGAALRGRILEARLGEPPPRPAGADFLSRPYGLAASEPVEEPTQQVPRAELTQGLLQADLSQHLGPRATSVVVSSAAGIGQQLGMSEPWLRLLRSSRYEELYGFELGLRRLHYATIYSPRLGLTGTYLNWVARLSLEQVIRRQDQPRMDRVLRFLGEGGPIGQLEEIASEIEPGHRLFSERLFDRSKQIAALVLLRGEAHRRIRDLPLSKEARQTYHAYVRLLPNDADRIDSTQSLRDWLSQNPDHRSLVEGALVQARTNPVGALRVQRLINVVTHEPSNLAKLRELNDADLGARGRSDLIPVIHDAEVLGGSQDDGYLHEPELTRELSLLYRRMPDLFDPQQMAERKARTQEVLEEVWPSNRNPINAGRIQQALRLFKDPVSQLLEQDLTANRFRLVFLTREELSSLRRSNDPLWQGGEFHGLFIPAERDASGRDTVYLERVGPASHAAHRDQAFNAIAHLIHEHTHFRRAANQTDRGLRGTYLEEMLAEALMLRWRAEHGDVHLIRHFQEINAGGLGLFLRDWVNHIYFVRHDKNF